MDAQELHPYVEQLFPCGAARSVESGRQWGTRVALEHEMLTADAATGAPASVERVRSAVGRSTYAPYVSFEPGGQVELSLPPAGSAGEASRRLRASVAALRADLGRAGVVVHALPVDPRPEAEVPLQLTSPRYRAMQRHFDTIGTAGRRMMRRTASTQVCLDWWPGREGLEQWRALNLVAPYVAAATARTTGPTGRLATWLAVDPARPAMDGRLLHGDPVASYAAFAAGARVFVGGGPEAHLTTLFPPVRPRGRYLEVRCLDVQEVGAVSEIAVALARVMYDDATRSRVLRRLEPGAGRTAALWRAAAAGDPDLTDLGRDLLGLAPVRTERWVAAA